MTEQEIQTFLSGFSSGNPNHISQKVFSGHNAAYWIKKATDTTGINPRLLLTKLQSEEGLITGPRSINPTEEDFAWAVNAGNGDRFVDESKKGFQNQMMLGAKNFLAFWYTKAKEFDYTESVDGSLTKALNAATFSLLKYTPHVIGNHVFYTVYDQFFGTNDLGGPTQ